MMTETDETVYFFECDLVIYFMNLYDELGKLSKK